jgi:hypothetical protein
MVLIQQGEWTAACLAVSQAVGFKRPMGVAPLNCTRHVQDYSPATAPADGFWDREGGEQAPQLACVS